MRIRAILEGMWPVYKGTPNADVSYKFYVDMDGVLVDLEAALRGRSKKRWKSPDAIIEALGPSPTPETIYNFWMTMPKTRECDAVWSAAYERSNSDCTLLTVVPDIGIEGADKIIKKAKFDWARANLSPVPKQFVGVEHGTKQVYAKGPQTVLIDDDTSNISRWRAAGGSGVLHIRGSTASTMSGINHPEGQIGLNINMASQEGVPTALQTSKSGGRKHSKFRLNGIDYHMSVRNVTIPTFDANNELELGERNSIDLLAVYQARDKTVNEVVKLLKHNLHAPQVQDFLNQSADAIAAYARSHKWSKVDNIIVPESSSGLATAFAQAISAKMGISSIIPWPKTKTQGGIKINRTGAAQYAATMNAKVGSTRQLNPFRRTLSRDDPARYQWTTDDVVRMWQYKADQLASGEKQMKQMDKYIRRGNLINLHQAPAGAEALVHKKVNMIVDDVSTQQTTVRDIARTLIKLGSGAEVGCVLWLFE